MPGIRVHVRQAAHELFVRIVAQPGRCASCRRASAAARRAPRHPRPALDVLAHQRIGLLQQFLVAVGPLHSRHRLQPLSEYSVRVRTTPAAQRAPRSIGHSGRHAIPMQDVVVRYSEVVIPARRCLPLPETRAQAHAAVVKRLNRHSLVRSRPRRCFRPPRSAPKARLAPPARVRLPLPGIRACPISHPFGYLPFRPSEHREDSARTSGRSTSAVRPSAAAGSGIERPQPITLTQSSLAGLKPQYRRSYRPLRITSKVGVGASIASSYPSAPSHPRANWLLGQAEQATARNTGSFQELHVWALVPNHITPPPTRATRTELLLDSHHQPFGSSGTMITTAGTREAPGASLKAGVPACQSKLP